MRCLLSHRPSPATVIALLALLVASAGSATAASVVTAALITGRDIKDASVTGKDIRDKSLTPKDFRGSVQGPPGPAGPQGETGEIGEPGPPGESGSGTGSTATLAATVRESSDALTVPGNAARNGNYVTVAGEADCEDGEIAVGGGLKWDPDLADAELIIVHSHPKRDETGKPVGWVVKGGSDIRQNVSFTVEVVCVALSSAPAG